MRNLHLLLAGAVAASALIASGYTFNRYMMAPSAPLFIPIVPDSLDSENPFEASQLLSARSDFKYNPASKEWISAEADTAGVVNLDSTINTPVLYTLATRLRADKFAKGKLSITTPARASVLLNGEIKISKEDVDTAAAPASAAITLLPEADNEIIVNILSMTDDGVRPYFKLDFDADKDFEDVTLSTEPMQSLRVSPLSTMVGCRTISAELSPSGKYLLTKYRDTRSASDSRNFAVLTETSTGRVLSENIDYSSNWIPNESALYYMKANGKTWDALRVEIPSMRVSTMATGVPDANPTISPSGRYYFYYKSVEAAEGKGPMHRVRTPDDRMPGNSDRYYIMRYDAQTGIALPLTYGGATTSIYDISHDGSKLLYGVGHNTPDKFPFYNLTLIQTDLNTLKNDTIIKNCEATIYNALYSPDARKLFVVASPAAFDGIGANYAPHEIANEYDGQGYIFDIASRKASAMTRDFTPAVESICTWNQADNKIYFIGEAGFNRFVYRLDPANGKISKVDAGLDYVRNFSIGDKDADWMAAWGGSFTNDGVATLTNLHNMRNKVVANPMAPTLGEIEFGKMEQWKFTATDGTVIDGYYCLPPGFDPAKKYPMIVYYYGGTSPSTATFYHLYSPQVFASRGYVVYVLNPSGTTGYGQEFSARHVNAWGKRTADEIIEGTKFFCREHPFVDDKKIGCIGASYGGFMTQYLQTKTDIFAAAVSHAGISNVTSYWGEGYWGYSYNSVAAAKRYPWTDPDLFTRQGSLFNADKIHTPLLLLHGTDDTNVPIGESIQLFNALKILGREVEFITVQDENHVVSGFDNKIAWQNTIMAWFAKWLKDDPRWWNELYK